MEDIECEVEINNLRETIIVLFMQIQIMTQILKWYLEIDNERNMGECFDHEMEVLSDS